MGQSEVELLIEADGPTLATVVAARTIELLARAQADRGSGALVLTGGSILEAVFTALATAPTKDTVDWSRVDLFWGDERFVATDSEDRNFLPAQRLLIDRLPFDPARIYPMPPSDGLDGADLDAAAARYAATLADLAGPARAEIGLPVVDVVLLGMGPDGHCASLFPGHPGLHEENLTVIGIQGSPKPPPLRTSLSFTGLGAAEQVWVIASGEGKADAVARALGDANRFETPVIGARGRDRTVWLLDEAAASRLPNRA